MTVTTEASSYPDHVEPYQVRARLGAGGMGVVYRGVSPAGEPVAIKQIKSAAFAGDEERQWFTQEVEALKTVFGPRVVSFVDADPDADVPWLATEYVPGHTLHGYGPATGRWRPLLPGHRSPS